jgi:hypothetical protein
LFSSTEVTDIVMALATDTVIPSSMVLSIQCTGLETIATIRKRSTALPIAMTTLTDTDTSILTMDPP